MVVVGLLGLERVKTTVANVCFSDVFGSVGDQPGHVLNPDIMLFAGVILVFQEQEIDVMGSVTLRRKVLHAEPILVFFVNTQNVHAHFGIEQFEKGYLLWLHGKTDSLDV